MRPTLSARVRVVAALTTCTVAATGAWAVPAEGDQQAPGTGATSPECTVGQTAIATCIPDPELATIVAGALGKDAGEPLTAEDIEATTSISAPVPDPHLDEAAQPEPVVTSLAGIGVLTSLETLELPGQQVQSLADIAPLASLRTLDLSDNAISGLDGVASLTELRQLDLSGNRITSVDTSMLAGLTHLGEDGADNTSPDRGLGSQHVVDDTIALAAEAQVRVPVPTIDGTPFSLDESTGATFAPAADAYAPGDTEVVFTELSAPQWTVAFTATDAVPSGGRPLTYGASLEARAATATITFDSAGGTDVAPLVVPIGSTATAPEAPTRENHEFAGWTTEDGTAFDFTTTVNGPLALRAQWRAMADRTFTVSFDSRGGSPVDPVIVPIGGFVPEPPEPTYPGYEFVDWNVEDGDRFEFTTAVTHDLSLVAEWKPAAGKPNVTRWDGNNRYETSLKVLRAAIKDGTVKKGAPVFVVSGADFPDALSASPAAAKVGGIVVLTPPNAARQDMLNAVAELAPKTIYVVGGTGVVSSGTAGQFGAIATVKRLYGNTRFATSVAVLKEFYTSEETTSAFIAGGYQYADALSGSVVAGINHQPIVLVNGSQDTVPTEVSAALSGYAIGDYTILGGEGVVSTGIASELDRSADIRRIGGPTRFATAALLASMVPANDSIALASGWSFADGLSIASVAATRGWPLYLSEQKCVPQVLANGPWARPHTNRYVVGGKPLVSDGVAENLSMCADNGNGNGNVDQKTKYFGQVAKAVANPKGTDLRIVVAGSSTADAAVATHREQGWAFRLGYRLGAQVHELDSTETFGQRGTHWYHAAQGGTTSANYLPAARMARLLRTNPNIVIHMVGSNDWASNVDPAVYGRNLRATLQRIEAANPNVVQLLIHQQPRNDQAVANARFRWSDYRRVMAEVAREKPSTRTFFDLEQALTGFDIGTESNRWDLVAGDNIHLKDGGHLMVADIIGELMGIPTETGTLPVLDVRKLAFQPSHTYPGSGHTNTVSGLQVAAVPYPRLMRINTNLFTKPMGGQADLELRMTPTFGDPPLTVSRIGHQDREGSTSAQSQWFYIPPGRAVRAEVGVKQISGSGVYVSGHEAFATGSVELLAI